EEENGEGRWRGRCARRPRAEVQQRGGDGDGEMRGRKEQGLAHRRTRDPHMSLFGLCDVRAQAGTREDEGDGSGDEGDEEGGGEWGCAGTRVRALITPSLRRYKEAWRTRVGRGCDVGKGLKSGKVNSKPKVTSAYLVPFLLSLCLWRCFAAAVEHT
ncbi:hypothetical protein B0H16DRAFT_1638979, partial [Mycena metata]